MSFLDKFLRAGPKEEEKPSRIAPAIAQRIRDILGIRELEAMPMQAARAFQLASDPSARMADFIAVIESDEALSARVIRIANSVYFFRGTPSTDIEKAVANIGLDELRCLLSASMLRSLLQGRHRAREQIWSNSVATAICCRNLSRFTKDTTSGEAFLCGLLHDVGKLVMIRKGGGLYDKVISLVGSGERTFEEAEEEVFELNHVEVGRWVGEEWNFPPQVITAIAEHHLPWPSTPGGALTVAQMVKAGDCIAHAAGIGHPLQMRGFARRCDEQLIEAFGLFQLGGEDRASFMRYFKEQFEKEFALYQPDNK
jgi:HD-like signal output (HDOD) protein